MGTETMEETMEEEIMVEETMEEEIMVEETMEEETMEAETMGAEEVMRCSKSNGHDKLFFHLQLYYLVAHSYQTPRSSTSSP